MYINVCKIITSSLKLESSLYYVYPQNWYELYYVYAILYYTHIYVFNVCTTTTSSFKLERSLYYVCHSIDMNYKGISVDPKTKVSSIVALVISKATIIL